MKEPMLKMRMSLVNTELGEDHLVALERNRTVYNMLGETDLSVLGEFFNDFLKAAGYKFDKDYIPMMSVDEDELWYLEDCLAEYRANQEKKEEVN